MQKQLGIIVIVAVLFGAAGFFGGMYYKSQAATAGLTAQFAQNGQGQGRNGRFGGGRGGFGGMATIGTVISADSNSITVQLQDGSSKLVNVSGSTSIMKTSAATTSDLSNGTKVAVFGTTNSDGSVTAQSVQINPMVRVRPSGAPTQAQ